jgi:hypothetical protein
MANLMAARRVMVAVVGLSGMAACTGNSPAATSLTSPAPSLISPAPAVTAVAPSVGSIGGGASMTIAGTGFKEGVTVTFDGTAVAGRFDTRDKAFTTILLETPAHVLGAVDLVVTNSDGQSQRLTAAYTYVSAGSFDLNGRWTGGSYDGSDRMMTFTIQDSKLVSASCSYDSTVALALPSPVSASNGEFSFVGSDGASISGRIVSPSEVIGTMNFSVCTNMLWRTYPRSPSAGTSQ